MKVKLSFSLLLLGCLTAFAQQKQTADENQKTIPLLEQSESNNFRYDMLKMDRPKQIKPLLQNEIESHQSPFGNQTQSNSEVTPFAQINTSRWGVINDYDTNGEVLYSSERDLNTFTVKTYDDDIFVVDEFSIQVPESANQVEVLDHYSSQFFNSNATQEFLIYLHYFEGENPGPDDQVFEIWVVESDGNIIEQVSGTNARAKIDADGNHKLFTYLYDEGVAATINAHNVDTWTVENTYSIDSDLINYFAGIPYDFIEVDGQEYIVIAHYESLLMDNISFEVYPDNSLIIKLLNFDLVEQKTMSLDIDTRYPNAGEFVIPMASYGLFYRDQTYDISSDIFNADSNLEVVYGIHYYDMIADNEWDTYLVADENGNMIHELNQYLISNYMELQSIEGEDNQLAFLMGEDGMATNLGFFDIESWSFQMMFSAEYNGDILSNKFNRIPVGESYHYLIGIGNSDVIEGVNYGVIAEYDKDGTSIFRHQFELPNNVQLFSPVLTPYALIPNLFTEENDDRHFMYIYKEQSPEGPIFNNLVVSKGQGESLVEFRGDTDAGNIVGSNFLTDGNGTFNKMTIQYEQSSEGNIVDFYRLPFNITLGVEDQIKNELSFFPNPTTGQLNFSSNNDVKNIEIYNIQGQMVYNKSKISTNNLDVSNLSQGVYFMKLNLDNGSQETLKFIKK